MKCFQIGWLAALALFISACSFSLSADITPPPGAEYSEAVPTQSGRASVVVYPLVPPDPNSGKIIYDSKCASCHGANGKGDGERANQLPNPVTALSSLDIIRQAKPSDWFYMIKNGNLERYMPPFPSLSDRQIWDVVAYLYHISAVDSFQDAGKKAFQDYCVRCHGEQAKGDGIDAAKLSSPPANIADLAFMSRMSSQDLYRSITIGLSPDMPPFGNILSEEDRWAIIDYLRSLKFSSPIVVAVTPTPEITSTIASAEPLPNVSATSVTETGIITGRVVNGTDNDPTSQLTITLRGFDNSNQVITETTKTTLDGKFSFHGIELVEGRVFIATAEFDNTTYSSDVTVVAPGANSLDLPITVYKTTTDPSIIKVDRLHLFFEMVDDQTVRVIELYIMSNPSNLTLIQEREGVPTIKFKLPVGSKNLQFQDSVLGERYIETPDGFGDTYGVRPGSGNYQVLFAFEMPYNRKMELVQTMLLPVDAVVILIPEGTLRIQGEILQEEGVRTVENTQYRMYSGGRLNVGQDLNLTITGSLRGSPVFSLGRNPNLVIGMGMFALSLALSGFWLFWHNRKQRIIDKVGQHNRPLETSETLMDAILALDDLYQAGELPEEAYHSRRQQLKERLKTVMSLSDNFNN
ncbi:MAG: c-type cytochrome [Chloroflexi bacterium]|nr:c-type cytochrome [Chloroflexota bacterium]